MPGEIAATIQVSDVKIQMKRNRNAIADYLSRKSGSGDDSPCQGEMSQRDRGGRDRRIGIVAKWPKIPLSCPPAILWFLSDRSERNPPPERRKIQKNHPCKSQSITSKPTPHTIPQRPSPRRPRPKRGPQTAPAHFSEFGSPSNIHPPPCGPGE